MASGSRPNPAAEAACSSPKRWLRSLAWAAAAAACNRQLEDAAAAELICAAALNCAACAAAALWKDKNGEWGGGGGGALAAAAAAAFNPKKADEGSWYDGGSLKRDIKKILYTWKDFYMFFKCQAIYFGFI